MTLTHLECTACARRFDAGTIVHLCECGGPVFARYDLARAARTLTRAALKERDDATVWRYAEVLPVDDAAQRVSLGEGRTPLLAAPRLGASCGLGRLYVKDESGNPTGSFKARGMAVAVAMAKRLGAQDVCAPSAGNAGSALAAYAARAGLRAHVFLPRDVPRIFITEAESFGAEVRTVDGLITDAGRHCAEAAKQNGWYDCATLKEPYRVEGKKTMGYELAEQLGWRLPDAIVYPTGGGTGLIGMWKAFDEMEALGLVDGRRPRMITVQAEGCAPIVRAFATGGTSAPFWDGAATLAHGLRIPRAVGDALMLRALRESRGAAVAVSDAEMVAGVRRAAAAEGIFMAPEGGACVAALPRLLADGVIGPDDTTVVFDTGTGLKYVESMAPHWGDTPAGA
ncbi:MAG: threonine synthase [Vicinamibacteria bacterium]